MVEVALESPLAGLTQNGPRTLRVDGRPCTLSEIPLQDMLNLRGALHDGRFAQAVLACTGLALPIVSNTTSLGGVSGPSQLLWLGPDEWLLKLPKGQGEAVMMALAAALQGQHCALTQVGDGNSTLRVEGPAAADLLARGCPLDLHPRAFTAGLVAQTHVAKASATVLCLEAGTHFELTVRRSFADYLYRWLISAGDSAAASVPQ